MCWEHREEGPQRKEVGLDLRDGPIVKRIASPLVTAVVAVVVVAAGRNIVVFEQSHPNILIKCHT